MLSAVAAFLLWLRITSAFHAVFDINVIEIEAYIIVNIKTATLTMP